MNSKAQAATQSDVARVAGVSRSLVSLALSGSPKVARETRERIQAVAAKLGYRVNVSASSLARRRSNIVGLVLPNLRNAFFERVARCLGEAAQERGLTLFVTVGAEQPEVLHQGIESLLGVRVAGIILVSPWLPDADLLAIGEETPTCLIGRRSPGGRVDAAHIDEPAAAQLVVDHLTRLGARTIAYIGPRLIDEASRDERERALVAAAVGAGVALVAYDCDEDAGPAVRRAVEEHPEPLGLVMHNDGYAIGAVPVLAATPRPDAPVLLASYDDTYLAERGEFALTSINQHDEDLARAAIELLCGRSEGENATAPARVVTVAPELVERASSRGDR